MFEGLLKPKNYTKCKTNLKLIKTRLETIRKKRTAVQRFLKKDLADLLRNSLDYNAYGRAEGLLVEQNMSACYELIAKFVECVSGHVREICKHEDCPDECKEAIPSLVYAAARFSDLPELRELRSLFSEKYGNSLEPHVNEEFIERLKRNPPSKEMKIQLLHELAQEFSIDWDMKSLEQRLYSPPLSRQEKEKPKDDEQNDSDNTSPKIDDVWWSVQRSTSTSTDSETTITDTSSQEGQKACSSSLENVSDDNEETEVKKPFTSKFAPPPYIRENKFESNLNKTTSESPTAEKPKPRSVRRRPLKPPPNENTVKDFSKTGDGFEEKMVDELLMHYSEKQPPYESDKEQNKRPIKSISQRDMSKVETLQGRGRTTSLVPEMLRTKTTRHVHPSLPEYDDLSARLAALRRT
ncbi:unnamed protein product [Lathyrus oleraceus]|uniref:Regulator of Vps4 activity in the MVB pathway protein n=3 Tax=Pisum sativum TaxID=3888 RepID=A0A9D4X5E6_PEA|nr:uncharacterized protein LOC127087497 [Pisum sativum]KAI5413982.1 hypothetical protein KIW84_058218 [Pisum sativum]